MVFLNFFTFLGVAVDTPVDQTRNVLVLIGLRPTSLGCSSSFIITWFLEALFLNSILYIETVGTASLISDKKFSASIIKTNASDICLGNIMENILKTAIRSIPDFNTGRMRRDKSVEDGVV